MSVIFKDSVTDMLAENSISLSQQKLNEKLSLHILRTYRTKC